MNPTLVIAAALDDAEQVFGVAVPRWDQANAVIAALTRYGYQITNNEKGIHHE